MKKAGELDAIRMIALYRSSLILLLDEIPPVNIPKQLDMVMFLNSARDETYPDYWVL
jgi:hypothetical protein